MQVTIVGLGETGATVAALLIEKIEGITINVIDPSEWVEGKMLDLQHAAAFKSTKILRNDWSAAAEAEYLFFCAGVRNPKEGDRMDVVQENKALITAVFSNFKPKKDAIVIVLTNPVEAIAQWIYEHLEKKNIVVGTGTELDRLRLAYLMQVKSGVDYSQIHAIVIGEHGSDMVAVFSQSKVKGEKASAYFSAEEQKALHYDLVNAAKTIRRTEEATKYGVAQCAIDIMVSFMDSKPAYRVVSVPCNRDYAVLLNCEEGLFLSLPVEIYNRSWRMQTPLGLTENEKKDFSKAVEKLSKVQRNYRAY
ncbi:MAG: hypothetical protein JJT77_03000 [Crocinitomicaceae bacterium]|nr:hypothetical protein [Crocinitomicaceae bacterium]